MRVPAEQLLPSQDFLKPTTVGFILDCFRKGTLDQLPPAPIVRKDENGRLIAIDGHNLIAVKLYRGEDVEVHLATSPDDGLPATSNANIQRNADLKNKYDSVLAERVMVQKKGIRTFRDLLSLYPSLFN